jgi:hypothetical protein
MILRCLIASTPVWIPVGIFAYWIAQGCPHADDE